MTALPQLRSVTAAPVEVEVVADWPVPVWSRGVMLDDATYCFADLKGTVCLLDLGRQSVTELGGLGAPVSADLCAITIEGEAHAAVATHGGNLVFIDRNGSIKRRLELGNKIRAGLQVVEGPAGTPLLAVIDSRSTLTLVDPATPERTGFSLRLHHWPIVTEYGVVASPLFFDEGGRNKLFLTGRSGIACHVDLAGGRVEWSELLRYGVDSDPVRDPESGHIFFTTGESLHGQLLGQLIAYDPARHRTAWRADLHGGADVMPMLTRWRDRPVVVTATLMDASIYVFDRDNGRLLHRAGVPATAECHHSKGGCIPVGYGVYHTQTAVCKFYASPFAVVSEDDTAAAICAASRNGRLYCLEPDRTLRVTELDGGVRASPSQISPDRLLVHAGRHISHIRAPRDHRFVTGQNTRTATRLRSDEILSCNLSPRRAALAASRLRNKFRRRVLGRKME